MTINNIIIVGAGPAGIGVALLLKQAGLDYVILEQYDVGSSFLEWPEGMEMITPSFPSNAFGQMDLNSIGESTSPAFSFKKEHLSGAEYAEYLMAVADHFEVNVHDDTEVRKVSKQKEGWMLETSQGQYYGKYLIWAAGEFQNPQIQGIEGAEHCMHSAYIKHPDRIKGDDFTIIGGYESGVQLAFELVSNEKKVTLINPEKVDNMHTSDPSRALSPYTYEKYNQLSLTPLYTELIGEVVRVSKEEETYSLELKDKSVIETNKIPICATGFSFVKEPIEEFITYREDKSPQLDEKSDEFIGQKNLYLTGPSVRHDNHIFCFIYKFRQRFGVIVEDIMKKEGYEADDITLLVEKWKVYGMYLADLSCCDDECAC